MDYIQPTALPQLETESCFTERLLEIGVGIKRPHELIAFSDKREYVESILSTPKSRSTRYFTLSPWYRWIS
jgi:hypothetical protein